MLCQFYLLLTLIHSTFGCGITTHIEISHRTTAYFEDDYRGSVNYAELIQKHPDALMAGSPYPDAYYDSICADGVYHAVSEDTHWAPFVNASVNYIRQKYPKPWDEATEKLVVFLFGVVSHQVADIVWHSLGIDQGFLRTMGDVNFHGSFDNAHSVGDIGGDILVNYELNTSYIPLTQGWYIPTDDLYNIYMLYYGNETIPKPVIKVCSSLLFLERYIPTEDLYNIYTLYYNTNSTVPQSVIQNCTALLFLGRLAEVLAAKELFPDYAKKSPYMVDQFESYFLGGVDDMSGWTHRLWQETITMMEHGTQSCDIPKSTLFMHCNKSSGPNLGEHSGRTPGRNGYFTRPPLDKVSQEDISIQRELRGFRVTPTQSYLDKLERQRQSHHVTKATRRQTPVPVDGAPRQPDRVLYVQNDYAKLGKAYTTGDLNFDGFQDLIITAPGYGSIGSPQEGRVYIIYGDATGLPSTLTPDLDELEMRGQGQILRGWGTAQSRFGTSVAVVDINMDGLDDIAVGAPALVQAGYSPLQYNGNVLIYFGDAKKHIVARGAANITLACDKVRYCNLGFSMVASDTNQDGYKDLVVGTPFAPADGEQRGFVWTLKASKLNTGYQYMEVTQLQLQGKGHQNYSWYGYDLVSAVGPHGDALFVSQPEYRKCVNANCSYSDMDIQSEGRVWTSFGSPGALQGGAEFSQLGWSVDMGTPYPQADSYVLAVSQIGANVNGSISGLPYKFDQAGTVDLYTVMNGSLKLFHTLQGDRAFDRFGAKVKFFDLQGDGMSDLVIGDPLRSDDITEELYGADQGQVFVYYGGKDFPFAPELAVCGNSLVHPCPRLQASMVLEWTDAKSKTRFGSNLAFLKSKSGKGGQLLVTAEHASEYGRLAGAVGVFNMA